MKPYVYPKCGHKTPPDISGFNLRQIKEKQPKLCPDCEKRMVKK
jgi:hypothetical protein